MEVDPAQFVIEDGGFYTFKGEGERIDGKKVIDSVDPPAHIMSKYVRGVPDYDHNIFELKFDRSVRPKDNTKKSDKDQKEKFPGEGRSLRDPR